jgi:hypothetical protein
LLFQNYFTIVLKEVLKEVCYEKKPVNSGLGVSLYFPGIFRV